MRRSESKLNQEDHVVGEILTENRNTNIKFCAHLLPDLLEEYSRLIYSLYQQYQETMKVDCITRKSRPSLPMLVSAIPTY